MKKGILIGGLVLAAVGSGVVLGSLDAGSPTLACVLVVLLAGALVVRLGKWSGEELRRNLPDDLAALPETRPPVVPGSPEAEDLGRRLAILRLCAAELERRRQNGGPAAALWAARRKVALFVLTELAARLPEAPAAELPAAERKRVLAEHPLLRPAESPPPDPAQHYARAQWFRDLRAQVERFTAARRRPP